MTILHVLYNPCIKALVAISISEEASIALSLYIQSHEICSLDIRLVQINISVPVSLAKMSFFISFLHAHRACGQANEPDLC